MRIRQAFEGVDHGTGGLTDRLADVRGAIPALQKMVAYTDRIHVHRSSGNTTSMQVITNAVDQVWRQTGEAPMVVVDYLQKVHDTSSDVEAERVTVVVEQARTSHWTPRCRSSRSSPPTRTASTGKRLRAQHLRGSTALAYEADVLLVLAHKYQIIARHHLVFDAGAAERFKDWAVVSVEKNRNGRRRRRPGVPQALRPEPLRREGDRVVEKLVDERLYVE